METCDLDRYMIDERKRLAAAMGFTEFRFGEGGHDCVQGWWCWTPDGREVELPHPWVDANDDYAVLEWMRKATGRYEPLWGRIMPAINWKLFCENLYSRGLYDIGDYARAALKVLDNESV